MWKAADMPNDLLGLRLIVTAGGTVEPIDPVRVITNRSSGKMGFAFATAARDRGALVTLVSAAGGGIEDVAYVPIETVASLRTALLDLSPGADILVMAAAVSDFRVASPASEKIKKRERMLLELEPIPDFMRELPQTIFKVGFAAETSNLIEFGRAKFEKHGFDIVCANDVSQADAGFAVDTNRITILTPEGGVFELPLTTKLEAAHRVLDFVADRFASRRDPSSSGHLSGRSPSEP
jgi:phosphopantothenoylcysteine decarboxylase/phosphopantothenate--cysteine ligase